MLHEGKIIIDGSPEQIKTTDNDIVRRFVLGEADERELAGGSERSLRCFSGDNERIALA
jgi:ABC-type transporter Mla maintaining outer membrane lipid asymmetry ATPase subunit MlaF